MSKWMLLTKTSNQEKVRVNLDNVAYYSRNTFGGNTIGTILVFPATDDCGHMDLVVDESPETIDAVVFAVSTKVTRGPI